MPKAFQDSSNNSGPAASASREVIAFDQLSDKVDYHAHLRGSKADHGHTKKDARDMQRMGKQQELRRNFRTLSTLAFTVILQGAWEVLLVASTQGLTDGGVAGLFWSYVWTYCGMALVVLSLAEMASMAPTSGGQYHWVRIACTPPTENDSPD
jgi:choline transport protein